MARRFCCDTRGSIPPPGELFFLLFLVSLSSWLPALLHHGDYCLQDFPLLLVHLPDWLPVDRKAMFLVCNVILWIVFRDSGLLGSRSAPEEGPCGDPPARREGPPPSEARPAASSAGSLRVSSVQQGKGGAFVEEKGKGEEGEEAEEGEEEHEDEEEEEEEGSEENMDELNKRFEDFIRKVKRERTLEALQLVLV